VTGKEPGKLTTAEGMRTLPGQKKDIRFRESSG